MPKRGGGRLHLWINLSLVAILALSGCASQAVLRPPRQYPSSSPMPGSPTSPSAEQSREAGSLPPPGVSAPVPGSVPPPGTPRAPRRPGAPAPPPSPTLLASAQWVEEAIHAIESGNHDRAASLLERAISVEPNNGRAFYYYGLAMGERGDTTSALSLLRKAEILLQGEGRALGDVYAQMGVNLERLGRRGDAIRRYEQALGYEPTQALAQRRLQALRGSER